MIEIKHKDTGELLLRVDEETLEGADLSNTKLAGADLTGVNLKGANLGGANLEDAELTRADLGGASYNRYTRWPLGFDPQQHGAVLAQRSLPGLSPASDVVPLRPAASKPEAVALVLLQGIAILGIAFFLAMVFMVLPVMAMFGSIFHSSRDILSDEPVWLLLPLLLGCIGLLRFRRWAAVIVCGLGWGWLTYPVYVQVSSVGPTPVFDPSAPALTAYLSDLSLGATLLMTASVFVCWRHLKNGL
jgi:hypothetical protein